MAVLMSSHGRLPFATTNLLPVPGRVAVASATKRCPVLGVAQSMNLHHSFAVQVPATGGGASKLAGLPNYRFGGATPGRRRVLAAAQVRLALIRVKGLGLRRPG